MKINFHYGYKYNKKLTAFYKDAVILDPFVGSGTTAVAAKKLRLNYIGIDANPEYVSISEKRLGEISGCYEKSDFEQKTSKAKQGNLFNILLREAQFS